MPTNSTGTAQRECDNMEVDYLVRPTDVTTTAVNSAWACASADPLVIMRTALL
jgi:hypothetical protein